MKEKQLLTAENIFLVILLIIILSTTVKADTITFNNRVTIVQSPAYTSTVSSAPVAAFRFGTDRIALIHYWPGIPVGGEALMTASDITNNFTYVTDVNLSIGFPTYSTGLKDQPFNSVGFRVNPSSSTYYILINQINQICVFDASWNIIPDDCSSNGVSYLNDGFYYNISNNKFYGSNESGPNIIEWDGSANKVRDYIYLSNLTYTYRGFTMDKYGNIYLLHTSPNNKVTIYHYHDYNGSIYNYTEFETDTLAEGNFTSMTYDDLSNVLYFTPQVTGANTNSTFLIYSIAGNSQLGVPNGYQIVNNTAFDATACLDSTEYCNSASKTSLNGVTNTPLGNLGVQAACNTTVTQCSSCTELQQASPNSLVSSGFPTYYTAQCNTNIIPYYGCNVVNATRCTDVKHIDQCVQTNDGSTGWMNTEVCNDGFMCIQNDTYTTDCEKIQTENTTHIMDPFGFKAYIWFDAQDTTTILVFDILLAPVSPILCMLSDLTDVQCTDGLIVGAGQSFNFNYNKPGFGISKGTGEISTVWPTQKVSLAYYDEVSNATYTTFNCNYLELPQAPNRPDLFNINLTTGNLTSWNTQLGAGVVTPRSHIHDFDVFPNRSYDGFNQVTLTTGTQQLNQTVLTLTIDNGASPKQACVYYGNTTVPMQYELYCDTYGMDYSDANLIIDENLPTGTYTVKTIFSRWDGSLNSYYSGVLAMDNDVIPSVASVKAVTVTGNVMVNYYNSMRSEVKPYQLAKKNDPTAYQCTYLQSGCYDIRIYGSYTQQPDYQDFADEYNCITTTGTGGAPIDNSNGNNGNGGTGGNSGNSGVNQLDFSCVTQNIGGCTQGIQILLGLVICSTILILAVIAGSLTGFFKVFIGTGFVLSVMLLIAFTTFGWFPLWVLLVILLIAIGVIVLLVKGLTQTNSGGG